MEDQPTHKKNFIGFIDPGYGEVKQVNTEEITRLFQNLLDACLELIPNQGGPNYPYAYHSSMGNSVRALKHAKNEFIDAMLAFHATPNVANDMKFAKKV